MLNLCAQEHHRKKMILSAAAPVKKLIQACILPREENKIRKQAHSVLNFLVNETVQNLF